MTTEICYLTTLPGFYASFEAQWSVARVTDGDPARDHFEVYVETDALRDGMELYGTTHDAEVVARWLVGHGCPPAYCDYCDTPATHQVVGQKVLICTRCMTNQTSGPARKYDDYLNAREYARYLTEDQRAVLLTEYLTA